jgi:monovalent cation/proton antiporter MnhG/PhaG subunit
VTTTGVVAAALVTAGVAVELACVVGVLWMSSVFDRLHFAGAASTLAPVLVGAAVVVHGAGATSALIQLLTALGFLVVLNPLVTHATGRAARRRRVDRLGPEGEPAP